MTTSHWARACHWLKEAASWYGPKLFTMSKMFRSCHDIVMWANVHSFCLYTSASFYFADSTSIPTNSSSKSPSSSSISELLLLGLLIHLTYIGKSLNRSKSWRMQTICSVPRSESYKIQQPFVNSNILYKIQ